MIQGPKGDTGPPGPPGPSTESSTATLSVEVKVSYSQQQFCQTFVLPPSSDFTIQALAGNPPEPFLGSSEGTEVSVESGAYEVIVLKIPERNPEGEIGTWAFSEDCIGSIKPNEIKTCVITAVYYEGRVSGFSVDGRPNLKLTN